MTKQPADNICIVKRKNKKQLNLVKEHNMQKMSKYSNIKAEQISTECKNETSRMLCVASKQTSE